MNKRQASNAFGWRFRHFLWASGAVSALEYAILVGVIAIGISAALVAFSGDIEGTLTSIGGKVAKIKPGNMKLN